VLALYLLLISPKCFPRRVRPATEGIAQFPKRGAGPIRVLFVATRGISYRVVTIDRIMSCNE